MSGNDTQRIVTARHAHSEGAQARHSHQPESANPYPEHSRYWRAWSDGWQFAQTMHGYLSANTAICYETGARYMPPRYP